jgi:chloramphenicol-sensitive protein RarD
VPGTRASLPEPVDVAVDLRVRAERAAARVAPGGSAGRHRAGVAAGAGAYLLWGLLTLYWPQMEPASPVEILAHRIVWSLLLLVVALTLLRRWAWLTSLRHDAGQLRLLTAAGCLIGVNWYMYIWAVNNQHVLEASLGYYINPLLSALLGVVVLRERLHRGQWAGVALAFLGVAWLVVGANRPPWVSLGLAATFGLYGLAKKRVRLGAMESLTVETATLLLPAAAYLGLLAARGTGTFGAAGAGHALLLVSTGLVTAVPLGLFGAGAARIPLAMLGMLQYLTPTIQFLLGVLVLHEPVAAADLAAYGLVWAGLVVFVAAEGRRRRRRRQAEPSGQSVRG